MEFYSLTSIVAFFQKGGLFMYPILFVFVAGMAIAVERWFKLSRIRSVNRKMWNVLHQMLANGELEKAKVIINKDKSTISQMLAMGLARQGAVRRRTAPYTWHCCRISPPCWDCSAPSWG